MSVCPSCSTELAKLKKLLRDRKDVEWKQARDVKEDRGKEEERQREGEREREVETKLVRV